MRAGRTFTTSGPLPDLSVDGHLIGPQIRTSSDGGQVEVAAYATSLWPMHALEIAINGKVVANSRDDGGVQEISLR